MTHPRIRAILPVAMAAAVATAPAAADLVTSTRMLVPPADWTAVPPWDHNVPGVSTFPNNGNDGHTFNVVFPNNNLVTLDQAITIQDLTTELFTTIQLGGNTMTCNGALDLRGLTLDSTGTFVAEGAAVVQSFLVLRSVNATLPSVFLQNAADIVLESLASLTLTGTGVQILGDGDLIDTDSIGSFVFQGGDLVKLGGNGVSEVSAKLIFNGGTIRNESSGQIRFVQGNQLQLTAPTVEVANDGEIDFSGSTLVSGPMNVSGEGTVFVKGPCVVGALTTSGPDGLFVVTGPGTLSGSPITASPDFPVVLRDGGELANVTSEGVVRWEGGTIALVTNRGTLTTQSGGTRLVDAGGILTNTEGGVFDMGTSVAVGGTIMNTASGTWQVAAPVADGPGASELRNFGTMQVTGVSEFDVEFRSVGGTIETGKSLTLKREATLSGGLLRNVAGPGDEGFLAFNAPNLPLTIEGEVALDDASTFPGGLRIVDGLVLAADEDAAIVGTGELRIEGGDVSVDVIIVEPGVRLLGGQVTGGTTRGDYDFAGGVVLAGGNAEVALTNEGYFTITGLLPLVRTATLCNDSAVFMNNGSLLSLEDAIVQNSGDWNLNSGVEVTTVEPEDDSLFVNTSEGIVEFEQPGLGVNATFTVPVDNRGTFFAADESAIFLFGPVVQYDPVQKTLSGGTWQVSSGGRIVIQGAEIEELIDDAVVKVDGIGSVLAGLENIGLMGEGLLQVTSGASLDVTGNPSGGDLVVGTGGEFGVVSMNAPFGTAPSMLNAAAVTVRGVLTVSGDAIVDAPGGVELLDGGVLRGDGGTVTGAVTNTAGTIAPGDPDTLAVPATVNVDGDLALGAAGTLSIDLAGPGTSDAVAITGAATLDGTLVLAPAGGYEPMPGDAFDVLTALTVTGAFATVSAPFAHDVIYHPDRVEIVATGCAADITGDTVVDVNDLVAVVVAWGACDACPEDVTGDGVVNVDDLVAIVVAWGACATPGA